MNISVVIPRYNRPAYVEKAIASVMAQSRRPKEIIVVDDGSADETVESLERRYSQDIILLKMNRVGQQSARNAGVERASGDWIAFLDDDDTWDFDFLEDISVCLEADPDTVGAYSSFRVQTPQTIVLPDKFAAAPPRFWTDLTIRKQGSGWLTTLFPVERTLLYQPFFPSAMVVRKQIYEELGGFNPKMRGIKGEDYEFTSAF